MASKSKKRRRVFRASCILAALIIAGSSFAWFTSSDEVTNRLSASGDYDVSIVESFTPPAKWVPGQAVNKDVYAVNTGNVEAFVKESVTSVMTIVTEDAYKPTTNPTRPDADSIELTPAERYVVEAGAFLAYAPLASKFTYDTGEAGVAAEDVGKVRSGLKVIAMSPEPRQTEYDYEATSATDFQPDAEGLYVFRRTIGVDDKTQIENYTYDAYYYVPGTGSTTKKVQLEGAAGTANENKIAWKAPNDNDPNNYEWTDKGGSPTNNTWVAVEVDAPVDAVDEHFYKISDLAVTAEKATFAGDQDQRDGIVSVATPPTYGFYKDVTKTVVPTLTYDKLNNRLVASYNTGVTRTNDQLRTLAETYQNKAIEYQDALEEYAAALGDEVGRAPTTLHTDADLAAATTDLRDAVDALLAAEYARDAAKAAYDKAKAEADALKIASDKATAELSSANTAYGGVGDGDSNADTIMGRYERAETALGKPTDATTANTAWGRENAAKGARDTELGDATPGSESGYLGAKAIREAAVQDERNAFLDLVIATGNVSFDPGDDTATKRTKAETYLNGLTYQQMVNLNITNPIPTDSTAYSYYTKLINEKEAKEALDAAEATYEQKTREREEAQRTYDIAKAAKEAAEAALGDNDPSNEDESTAVGRANKAARLYKEKMEQCYGLTVAGSPAQYGVDGGEGTGQYVTADYHENATTGKQDDGSLFGTYKNKETAATNAQNTKNTKQGLYDNALAASNTAATNVTNAADRVAQTKQARDNAWNAYKTAYDATTGELKININLADVVTEGGVADKWQLLPESLEDVYTNTTVNDVNTITEAPDTKTDTASFYYTSILGGGETSAKLIDSVELDPSVTKEMFKYFDFDLNITLNSAQVNIDENGNYTAETAQSELGKYAILTDNTSADTAITWSDTSTIPESAKAKKYQGTFKDGDATPNTYVDREITELSSPMIFDYVDYNYVTVIDGKTYYGTGVGANAKFYKYDAATGTLLKENTTTVKDNVLTLDGAASRIYTKTVTFKNATDTTVPDTTAEYVYATSWTGTAPTSATGFSASASGTYGTIDSVLGTPTEDGTATVYYKTT